MPTVCERGVLFCTVQSEVDNKYDNTLRQRCDNVARDLCDSSMIQVVTMCGPKRICLMSKQSQSSPTENVSADTCSHFFELGVITNHV